ncbi:MAG: hypothetical protein FJY65_09990 [Calditrichaeota bacterium]|nr:hypothetical protein [Calditrichota bacterium]
MTLQSRYARVRQFKSWTRRARHPDEFGCKAGVATTSRDNWAIGDQALYGNPYDRRTLAGILTQVKHLTGWRAEEAYCDQGFRGHSYKCEKSSHRHRNGVS